MHSWEDFAFGRKIAGAILRLPERLVLIAKKKAKEMPVQTRTISLLCVLVGILAILGWRAVACAQDDSQAPAGTRSLADTPFQLLLPSEHLLGDWYGMRTWLEDHGITPTFTFVTDALGNPTGGKRQSFTAFNNLGVNLDLDLEKLYGPKGGSFEFSTSYRFGSSLSQKYIGNVFNVQQVCCGATLTPSTPWAPCSPCRSCGLLCVRQKARHWRKCRGHD